MTQRFQQSFPLLGFNQAPHDRLSYLDTVFHGLPDICHADTGILEAAANGDLAEVQLLIEKQADVNTVGYDKRTALHLACCESHKAVVQVLINHNANVNAKDRWGNKPLHGADSHTIIDLLLHAGAVGCNKLHDDLIHTAAEGDLKGVQRLIRCKAPINCVDYDMRTALHVSSACGHLDVVQFLIANGADTNLLDRWGRSAIADAIEEGHHTVEQALRHAGSPDRVMHLNMYCPGEVTVLLMDIKNFTSSCSKLSAHEVGEWVSTFYSLVDNAAGPFGVRKAEVRGDCCICVTGGMETAPCGRLRSGASAGDQVTRMLGFACILHASFLTASPRPTSVRMGMAYGDAAFLLDGDFLSIQGDVVNMAARMESHGVAGMIVVHVSAADRWASEACAPAPPYNSVECKGKDPQAAAVYNCMNRAFCDGFPNHYDI